jgi:hypothetical protein
MPCISLQALILQRILVILGFVLLAVAHDLSCFFCPFLTIRQILCADVLVTYGFPPQIV